MFKLWSELNTEAMKELKPDLGIRSWDSLEKDEKDKIWKYLEIYFFDVKKMEDLKGKRKMDRIIMSIKELNNKYKTKSYASNYLKYKTSISVCSDFYNIFMKENKHVVLELLSLYCAQLISGREKESQIIKEENESEEDFQNRLEDWRWEEFDRFAKDLNEVFTDFGLDVYLTRQGFIPRQDEKIIKEIYEPVLKFLSNPKWKEVNRILSDSFDEYSKNTPIGYSNCITYTVSAIQAFLQILVYGETGKGSINDLIVTGQTKNLIPKDFFTKQIFKNMESIFAKERKDKGTAHPNKGYADEKIARTILNLAMVFLQHCIQK